MKRFFGMMPSDSVEIEEQFRDECDLKIIIQAGPEGYSIIYADHSCDYEDIKDTSENNFDKAYRVATKNLGHLIKA